MGYAGCSGTTGSGALLVMRFLFFAVASTADSEVVEEVAVEVATTPALICCWAAPYCVLDAAAGWLEDGAEGC